MCPQPAACAFLAHCGGEGLVKIGVPPQVEALMGQFMKDQLRQICVITPDEGVQQRITQKAQSRISGDSRHEHIIAFSLDAGGFLLCQ